MCPFKHKTRNLFNTLDNTTANNATDGEISIDDVFHDVQQNDDNLSDADNILMRINFLNDKYVRANDTIRQFIDRRNRLNPIQQRELIQRYNLRIEQWIDYKNQLETQINDATNAYSRISRISQSETNNIMSE